MAAKIATKSIAMAGVGVIALIFCSASALAETYVGNQIVSSPQKSSNTSSGISSVGSGSSAPKAFRLGIGNNGGISVGWGRGNGISIGGGGRVGGGIGGGVGGGFGVGGDSAALDQTAGSLACAVLAIPEGAFGALVMIVSGLIAVIGAAMGMYRMALSTLVVGLGSFLIFPLVTLFFGNYLPCGF